MLLKVGKLGFFGTQKFAPRRGVEKQVAYFDAGAARMRRRRYPRLHPPAFGHYAKAAARIIKGVGGQRQARDRADRGQRFAAKPQRADALQITEALYFAGGMTGKRQRQIIFGDPYAIVAHLDQARAALLNLDLDTPACRIDGVFDQLFGHRGRALDHLAGGNLVGQARVEHMNFRRHYSVSVQYAPLDTTFIKRPLRHSPHDIPLMRRVFLTN